MTPRKQHARYHISLSRHFFDSLKEWCLRRGVSMAQVVEVVVARTVPIEKPGKRS